jgi:hypothetical protein
MVVGGAVNLISSYHCRYLPFMIDEWPLTNDEIDAMYHLPILVLVNRKMEARYES